MMRILSVIGALFLGGAFLTSCTTSGRVSTFVVLPDTQTYLEQNRCRVPSGRFDTR